MMGFGKAREERALPLPILQDLVLTLLFQLLTGHMQCCCFESLTGHMRVRIRISPVTHPAPHPNPLGGFAAPKGEREQTEPTRHDTEPKHFYRPAATITCV
jgi:hypothetical protein